MKPSIPNLARKVQFKFKHHLQWKLSRHELHSRDGIHTYSRYLCTSHHFLHLCGVPDPKHLRDSASRAVTFHILCNNVERESEGSKHVAQTFCSIIRATAPRNRNSSGRRRPLPRRGRQARLHSPRKGRDVTGVTDKSFGQLTVKHSHAVNSSKSENLTG